MKNAQSSPSHACHKGLVVHTLNRGLDHQSNSLSIVFQLPLPRSSKLVSVLGIAHRWQGRAACNRQISHSTVVQCYDSFIKMFTDHCSLQKFRRLPLDRSITPESAANLHATHLVLDGLSPEHSRYLVLPSLVVRVIQNPIFKITLLEIIILDS